MLRLRSGAAERNAYSSKPNPCKNRRACDRPGRIRTGSFGGDDFIHGACGAVLPWLSGGTVAVATGWNHCLPDFRTGNRSCSGL